MSLHTKYYFETTIPIKVHFFMLQISYRKRGKIRWAKHSRFSRFLSLPRKFSREFLAIRIINEHWWPLHRESISAKNFIGLKLRIFSPANISPFTVCQLLWYGFISNTTLCVPIAHYCLYLVNYAIDSKRII